MSESMTIQGRKLFAEDIELIRRLMADNPNWHRTRLSIELCRMWNWRNDKGQLKDIACRTMLRKLEQRQLIVLPPPLRPGNHARRIQDIPHSCDPIKGALDDLRPIEIVIVNGRSDANHLFHCLMDRYHYLGCHGHVGEHMKYMVYDRHKRPLACLLFGSAAWKTAVRDRYIGWNVAIRQGNLKLLTNNTRFLVLPWVRVPNLASFILGACLRRLRSDWFTRYGHDLCMVETFVDRSRFAGTCYQAANWQKLGQTKGRSRQDRHRKVKVPIKDLYVYPLVADFKKRLCAVG
jgi:hypothetical protein